MRMAALLMAMIALLGSPQGEGTVSETTWEMVAVQVLEETPETAARTLLDWAGSGQTIPEEDVVLALLEEMEAEPAASAVAFAAVLDRADSLRKAGEAPELGEETYRQEEPSAWPADLAAFDGIWCDSTLQELLIFQSGTCRVVIPYLDYYGETAFSARLRDRGGMGWCPSLEIDIHESGDFSGPLTYYVSGLAEDHFWCNTQGQRFDRL